MESVEITINEDGQELQGIYSDLLEYSEIGDFKTARISHVEPHPAYPGFWVVDLRPVILQFGAGYPRATRHLAKLCSGSHKLAFPLRESALRYERIIVGRLIEISMAEAEGYSFEAFVNELGRGTNLFIEVLSPPKEEKGELDE